MSSVRLFVERAARVWPGFGLAADNAEAVIELCRRLDGMPLGLELAAAAVWFQICLGKLAQAGVAVTGPFLPVSRPSLQLVPIAGRLVPCIGETLLLGRRVGSFT